MKNREIIYDEDAYPVTKEVTNLADVLKNLLSAEEFAENKESIMRYAAFTQRFADGYDNPEYLKAEARINYNYFVLKKTARSDYRLAIKKLMDNQTEKNKSEIMKDRNTGGSGNSSSGGRIPYKRGDGTRGYIENGAS